MSEGGSGAPSFATSCHAAASAGTRMMSAIPFPASERFASGIPPASRLTASAPRHLPSLRPFAHP